MSLVPGVARESVHETDARFGGTLFLIHEAITMNLEEAPKLRGINHGSHSLRSRRPSLLSRRKTHLKQ